MMVFNLTISDRVFKKTIFFLKTRSHSQYRVVKTFYGKSKATHSSKWKRFISMILKKLRQRLKNNKGYRSLKLLPIHGSIICFILVAFGDKEDADKHPDVDYQCLDSYEVPDFI